MVISNGRVADWLDDAKKNAGWLIVLGVVTVIAGFLALVMPWASGVGVTLFVGLAFVVGGVARLIGAFSAGSFGRGTLAFIGGALTLLAGVIMVARPGSGLAALTLMLGSYLIVDCIFGAVLAFQVRSGAHSGSDQVNIGPCQRIASGFIGDLADDFAMGLCL